MGYILLTTVCLLVVIAFTAVVVIVVWGYIRSTAPDQSPENTFEELLIILNLIINTELDEYDKEIFVAKGSVNNQNFEAFYKDLNKRIIANISDDVMVQFTRYTTQANVYRIVARAVKEYLRNKIYINQ